MALLKAVKSVCTSTKNRKPTWRSRRQRSLRRSMVLLLLLFIFVYGLLQRVRMQDSSAHAGSVPVVRSHNNTHTHTPPSQVPVLPPLLKLWQQFRIKPNERSPETDLECSYDKPPPRQKARESFRWQPVSSPSTAKAYVFSAYYDRRWNPPVVMIIGLASEYNSPQNGDRQRFCRMWFRGERKPRTVAADFRFVPETHGRPYAAVLYTCPSSSPPYAVSLISTCSERPRNTLKVVDHGATNDNAINGSRTVDYTVCMALLHSDYPDFKRIVKTIEFNLMFGAQRVVIYHSSSSPDVRLVLDSYERDGIVEIIPWHSLPVASWDEEDPSKPDASGIEVHYFGQLAALNDCLYRNLFRSNFVLFSDVDEVAVPREAAGEASWSNVLEIATHDWSPEVKFNEERFPGVYIVRSAFFPPNPQPTAAAQSDLSKVNDWLKPDHCTVIDHFSREDEIFPHGIRSKLFVWTKAVVMIGIHFPYELINGAVNTIHVNENLCLLHHERARLKSSAKIIGDDWMSRYSQNVTRRIHDRCNTILNYLPR